MPNPNHRKNNQCIRIEYVTIGLIWISHIKDKASSMFHMLVPSWNRFTGHRHNDHIWVEPVCLGSHDNAPLLILAWGHRVRFVAEYPVSVSLVNTQIYSALNHPRGEYCQLHTFKTQIQLNTIQGRQFNKKRWRKN